MKKFIALLILVISLGACKKSVGNTNISGEIKGLGNDTILLYATDDNYEKIDTIYAKDDKFSYTLEIDTLTSALLVFQSGVEYPIFLDKQNQITLTGSKDNLSFLKVEGNTPNEEYTAFQQALKGLGTPSEQVLEKKAEEFIRQHSTSITSVYLLDKYFAQKASPDFDKIKELIESLSGILQDHPTISKLNDYITQLGKTDADKIAPFFSLRNEKEELITRAEKFKDQYVLISFWASWEKGSEAYNAKLREINRTYKKNKDFALLSISLDVDKQAWKEAIRKDTLNWEQAYDLSGLNSEIAKQYALLKLPSNILVSPTGRIIARDIPTDSIASQVKQVLKEAAKKESAKKR